MYRKSAVLIFMCMLCLGLYNCKGPTEPEVPLGQEPVFEYRTNVEVIWKGKISGYGWPGYTPALWGNLYEPAHGGWDKVYIEMEKIGEDTFRCFLPKVFIQTPAYWKKHDLHGWGGFTIQGAYEWQKSTKLDSSGLVYILQFKMSKD